MQVITNSILVFLCRRICLSSVLLLFSYIAFSQDTILRDTIIDKPTKLRQLEQSRWDKLGTNKVFSIYFRISSIGSSNFFEVRVIRNDEASFEIENGQRLVFKYRNGDSLSIINPTNTYSCQGCGSVTLAVGGNNSGIEVEYLISQNELNILQVNLVKKLIIYTSMGKLESELTVKDNTKILNAIIASQDL